MVLECFVGEKYYKDLAEIVEVRTSQPSACLHSRFVHPPNTRITPYNRVFQHHFLQRGKITYNTILHDAALNAGIVADGDMRADDAVVYFAIIAHGNGVNKDGIVKIREL